VTGQGQFRVSNAKLETQNSKLETSGAILAGNLRRSGYAGWDSREVSGGSGSPEVV